MAPSFAYPKTSRVRQGREFRRTLDRGRKTVGPLLVVFLAMTEPDAEPAPGLRFGAIVSRKTGNAVARNRIKRHLREAFRHLRAECEASGLSGTLVVIARPPAAAASGALIAAALRNGVARLTQPRQTPAPVAP